MKSRLTTYHTTSNIHSIYLFCHKFSNYWFGVLDGVYQFYFILFWLLLICVYLCIFLNNFYLRVVGKFSGGGDYSGIVDESNSSLQFLFVLLVVFW